MLTEGYKIIQQLGYEDAFSFKLRDEEVLEWFKENGVKTPDIEEITAEQ